MLSLNWSLIWLFGVMNAKELVWDQDWKKALMVKEGESGSAKGGEEDKDDNLSWLLDIYIILNP